VRLWPTLQQSDIRTNLDQVCILPMDQLEVVVEMVTAARVSSVTQTGLVSLHPASSHLLGSLPLSHVGGTRLRRLLVRKC
jgi:hypothetical protein